MDTKTTSERWSAEKVISGYFEQQFKLSQDITAVFLNPLSCVPFWSFKPRPPPLVEK